MLAFPLILIASASANPEPVKCDAKPFTLNKPAPADKAASAKGADAKGAKLKAEPPKPILKPSCNHPGHAPGHKH